MTAIPVYSRHNFMFRMCVCRVGCWTEKDLKCVEKGKTEKRCSIKCDDSDGTCYVKSSVKRCTCQGYAVEMSDKTVFSLESGEKISAVGFSVLGHMCDSCVSQCKKMRRKKNKKWKKDFEKKGNWEETRVPCDDEHQEKSQEDEEKEASSSSADDDSESSNESLKKAFSESNEDFYSSSSSESEYDYGYQGTDYIVGGRRESRHFAPLLHDTPEPRPKHSSPPPLLSPPRPKDVPPVVAATPPPPAHDVNTPPASKKQTIPHLFRHSSKVTPSPNHFAVQKTSLERFISSKKELRSRDGSTGAIFERKTAKDTSFVEPKLSPRSVCHDRGNETRECIEECADDGSTCLIKVQLRRCSCSGIAVDVIEVQKFDLSSGQSVFMAAPVSNGYGVGYIRECGSCVKYCRKWPGETKNRFVATQTLKCKSS